MAQGPEETGVSSARRPPRAIGASRGLKTGHDLDCGRGPLWGSGQPGLAIAGGLKGRPPIQAEIPSW